MIQLHTFGPAFGQPDPSPFVMKTMILLKMAGQSFDCVPFAGGPNVGPKGKRPFIVDDGVTIPDSTFIRFHLEMKYGVDFDSNLSAQQKAMTWAVEKMCEEHLYFVAVYYRWLIDENFNKGPSTFFNSAPALIRPLVRAMVRRQVRKNLYAQGLGRHSEAQIAELGGRDIDALSALLADQSWMGGDTPCAADATVGAFVMAAMSAHFDTPLSRRVNQYANLVAYAQRIEQRFFAQ